MDNLIKLSPQEYALLLACARNGLEEHRVARRAIAIIHLSRGMSIEEVANVLLLDGTTIRNWRKEYLTNGYDGLVSMDYRSRDGLLSMVQLETLKQWVAEVNPRSTTEVAKWLSRQFSIVFESRSSLIKLLWRLGFEFRKPPVLPKKINEEAQQEFIDMYEKLKQNQGNEAIVFVDAVHPTYAAKPVGCWVLRGQKVALEQTSGRQRLNIHGAVNLEFGQTNMIEAETINADSFIKLLERIKVQHTKQSKIHVILDNARYHHAIKVKEWLNQQNCKIELHFIPPYCPHFNPIERLWGVMHKNITHNRSYSKLNDFADELLTFLSETVPKNWNRYCDQISDNFRIISAKNVRIL